MTLGTKVLPVVSHDQEGQLLPQEPVHFLGRTLSWLRWVIIAATLIITLLWPVQGRIGHSIWQLIAAFACYNLLVELLRLRVARLRSFAWVPVPDLLACALIYFLDYDPGGPTFVYWYLALITAAATLSLRGTVGYTVAVIAAVGAIAPSLPGWTPEITELRQLTSRLVIMALVGVGTAILARRLALEYEQTRSMRDRAEQLAELDRLRNEFISSVSHDLRTPLTALRAGLGMLEAQQTEPIKPDVQRLWGNAKRNVERLGMFIDDLLALNQLKAGTLQLNRESLDLRDVVANALASVSVLIQQKNQVLEVDLPVPLLIDADPWRIEQVIVNVLANAHRHTPEATTIVITGQCSDRSVLLSMRDDGLGIAPEELEAIFERFHRGPTSESGSGLGLAIAKAIVELHGGTMWAESKLGMGSTFSIRLPSLPHQAEQRGEKAL